MMDSARCARASIKWPRSAAQNFWKRAGAYASLHMPKASTAASKR